MNVAVSERQVASSTAHLKNKVSLVTGSTSGIGLGIARALAGAGSAVILNGFGQAEEIEAAQVEHDVDVGHGRASTLIWHEGDCRVDCRLSREHVGWQRAAQQVVQQRVVAGKRLRDRLVERRQGPIEGGGCRLRERARTRLLEERHETGALLPGGHFRESNVERRTPDFERTHKTPIQARLAGRVSHLKFGVQR